MRKDLDALMEEKGIDARLVSGPATHNPAMFYFTGNVHVGHGDLIKKRGEKPQWTAVVIAALIRLNRLQALAYGLLLPAERALKGVDEDTWPPPGAVSMEEVTTVPPLMPISFPFDPRFFPPASAPLRPWRRWASCPPYSW